MARGSGIGGIGGIGHLIGISNTGGGGRGVLPALLGLAAVSCWTWLLFHAARLAPGDGAGRALPAPYGAADLALLFALWLAAIAAMLLPAVAPSLLLAARAGRTRSAGRTHGALPFALGHLAVWCGCALAAGAIGWLLHDAGALDGTLAIAHPAAGALALVAAGVYQWTPAKHASLDDCRAPLAVLPACWRGGARDGCRLGAADAADCIGCWWLLLAMPLAAGVLNLPLVGALSSLILAEKLLPGGHLLACAAGLGLLAWGTALLFP